jgi:predicted double-glycine peptidase
VVVPHVTMVAQTDDTDCGPAALTTALTRWGAAPSPDAWQTVGAREGFTAGALRDEARRAGFASFVFEGTFGDLESEIAAGHPVVVGLVRGGPERGTSHFSVVVGHDAGARHWLLADPALGVRGISRDELRAQWGHAGWVTLVVFPAE